MKVLNLYAGIGGNRKLWPEDCEVIAIESDPKIASVYQALFPKDKVIVTDAHQFLLEHYKEFDFIWSSPPCPSHSDIRRCGVHRGQYEAVYPDMALYAEIILLKHFARCPWVVENVQAYYEPLIKPFASGRHWFWSNFVIANIPPSEDRIHNEIVGSKPVYDFDISRFDLSDKRKILRNLVDPKLGLHVFKCAFKEKQEVLI